MRTTPRGAFSKPPGPAPSMREAWAPPGGGSFPVSGNPPPPPPGERIASPLIFRIIQTMRFLSSFRRSPAPEGSPAVVSDSSFENFLGWNFRAETSVDPAEGAPVTTVFHSRLSDRTVERIGERISQTPGLSEGFAGTEGDHRLRELLRLGTHLLPEELERETGLIPFDPPADVHAMVRESIYCGDLFYNDMMVAALERAGTPVGENWRVLDFGCSSGRCIWPFSKAYPRTRCFGCDPIGGAVEWAAAHLPGIDFHQSPEKPPLRYADESFDFVFAISIWSHFGRGAGAAWRREMRRILRPGGLFLWTTHGPGALRHYCESGAVRMSDGERFFRELHRDGFSFYNPFGERGDWGIVSEEWGQAFLHPSHVLREALDGWKVLDYRSRHVENNQDLWLFEKR